MLDAGLKVVEAWGKRGRVFQVKLSDGSYHWYDDIVKQVAQNQVSSQPSSTYRQVKIGGLGWELTYIPHNILSEEVLAKERGGN